MILTNRHFERRAPSREAKSLYIFCEGKKREVHYFKFFKEMDSRVNVEVYPIESNDNNSPNGLFEIASRAIIPSKENHFKPKYSFMEGDEVWIVLDTDPDKNNSRMRQIQIIRSKCDDEINWFVVESNPCFEVWLYLHQNEVLSSPSLLVCSEWKRMVNRTISGGFDSRKHPVFISDAIRRAKNTLEDRKGELEPGTTQVYLLGESLINVLGEKIDSVKKGLNLDGK